MHKIALMKKTRTHFSKAILKVIMKVLFLLSFVAVAFASQECGENAHFESCGSACPLTCENYRNPPKICVARCDIGCHCDKGYVKTSEGRCIRPVQCPVSNVQDQTECGENAHFESCGTACPLTCENYKNPPKMCILRCDIGCHCDKGYVKSADGRCVRPEECPSRGIEPTQKNCVDEPQSGLCKASFPMWYYDGLTQKCHKFIYGGCGGNGNRYKTEKECMQNCEGIIAENEYSTSEVCDLPAESGLCYGYFPRYYFDKQSGSCKEFIYGGCQGNGNNFKSIEECEKACA